MDAQQKELQLNIAINSGQKNADPDSQSILITVPLQATLKQLKTTLKKQLNIEPESYHLTFNNVPMLKAGQGKKLTEFGIKNYDTLVVNFVQARGGGTGFNFGDFSNKKVFQSKKVKGFCHKVIKPGLILRAICSNQQCEVFGKLVCVNKGLGQFNMKQEIQKCLCPICQQKTQKATTLCYYKTKITIYGVKQNGDQFQYQNRTQGRQVHKFLEGDSSMSQWGKLEIITESL